MREQRLLEILTWKRPHESEAESEFVAKYIITPNQGRCMFAGPMRNVIIVLGNSPTTLFSCHTDTVHWKGGKQEICFDREMGMVYKNDNEPLGADDGTGVWLMLEMIRANVPGAYVFHRGEERGGVGSTWMSENMEEWLRKFRRAVAFDRREESHVITHQRNRRCCSDEFASALARQLGEGWAPNNGGTFTDTANYTHLIPECTNLSVGYYDQHSKNEMQNVDFAMELLDRCLKLDWESLPTVREAKHEVFNFPMYGYSPGKHFDPWDYDPYDPWEAHVGSSGKRNKKKSHSREQDKKESLYGPWDFRLTETDPPEEKEDPADVVELGDTDGEVLDLLSDYDNLTNDQLYKLGIVQLVEICEEDPRFAAFKISELLEEAYVQKQMLEDYRVEHEAQEQKIEALETENAALTKQLERKRFSFPAVLRSVRALKQ